METLSPRVKRPGPEADHSSPSSSEVKKARIYTFSTPGAFVVWCLINHMDTFTYARC